MALSQVCSLGHLSMVGRAIQTLTVDVSRFEVDTVCTQESTLERTQPHLFPSFQGIGLALPFLSVGPGPSFFPLIFTARQTPTQQEAPRGPRKARNFRFYSGFTRWGSEELLSTPTWQGLPPAPGFRRPPRCSTNVGPILIFQVTI